MAPGPLRIVPATPADARALFDLRRSVLAEGRWFATRADEHRGGPSGVLATIEALAEQPNGTLLVAWLGDELVGMMAVHGERLARMAHIGRMEMMVAQQARGQGIGKALFGAAVTWAERNPVLRKLSLAVFADNARGISIYERHGFVVEGRREGEYLLEDGSERADLLMARRG